MIHQQLEKTAALREVLYVTRWEAQMETPAAKKLPTNNDVIPPGGREGWTKVDYNSTTTTYVRMDLCLVKEPKSAVAQVQY
jgi:hypothetical protein